MLGDSSEFRTISRGDPKSMVLWPFNPKNPQSDKKKGGKGGGKNPSPSPKSLPNPKSTELGHPSESGETKGEKKKKKGGGGKTKKPKKKANLPSRQAKFNPLHLPSFIPEKATPKMERCPRPKFVKSVIRKRDLFLGSRLTSHRSFGVAA